jgi:mRNA interferase MazF
VEKERPAVVVQSDALTMAQGTGEDKTVIVTPITKDVSRESATGLRVSKGTGGLPRDSVILCDQIFTVKRAYLVKRLGRLPDSMMDALERRLQSILGFPHVHPQAPPAAAKPQDPVPPHGGAG